MHPNDYLAAINVTVASALLVMVGVFIRGLILQPELAMLQKVFLVGMIITFSFLVLDYGTIGIIRFYDNIAYPNIPHSLLPDFTQFPNGLLLLSMWRTGEAIALWALIFYMVVWKRGRLD